MSAVGRVQRTHEHVPFVVVIVVVVVVKLIVWASWRRLRESRIEAIIKWGRLRDLWGLLLLLLLLLCRRGQIVGMAGGLLLLRGVGRLAGVVFGGVEGEETRVDAVGHTATRAGRVRGGRRVGGLEAVHRPSLASSGDDVRSSRDCIPVITVLAWRLSRSMNIGIAT
jgi:hypothetical protein